MIHPRVALLATLVLLGASTGGNAALIFTANLTNSQEVPPVTPTLATGGPRPVSFGFATFMLNDAMTALSFTATIFNIDVTGTQTPDTNDNLIAAHLHSGPTALPGLTAPVVWGFFGSPFNDNNPNDNMVTPFATGVGGTFSGKWDAPEGNNTTLTAQLVHILADRSYINFHTVQFGGGEIRGQITAVPEPSSIALAGFGAIGLIGYGWLRPKRTR
ncbi:MAG: CHRD domain-containing protein [Singulisphaera sp.]